MCVGGEADVNSLQAGQVMPSLGNLSAKTPEQKEVLQKYLLKEEGKQEGKKMKPITTGDWFCRRYSILGARSFCILRAPVGWELWPSRAGSSPHYSLIEPHGCHFGPLGCPSGCPGWSPTIVCRLWKPVVGESFPELVPFCGF